MNDNNEIILKVGVDDDQAMAELRLLEQKINEIINKDGSGKTFAELKKEIKGITEFTKLMKTHGLDGTREFTALTNKAKELRVYSKAIKTEFGELSNKTFVNIANQAADAATQTEHFAQTVSVVGSEVNTSNQSMNKFHSLLELSDRTTSVEGLGGAFGVLNSILGFATQGMSEYASAQNTAERAEEQARKAQEKAVEAQELAIKAKEALARAEEAGEDTKKLEAEATRTQTAATRTNTTATEAQTVATEAATLKTKAFKAALVSIGIGLFILGLQTLIENWEKVASVLGIVTKSQIRLNAVTQEAIKTSASEVAQLKYLYAVSTDVNKSKEQRLAATKKLQEQYPSYFKNMNTEQIMLGKASKAYQELTANIIASAKAKAAMSMLEEKASEELEMEQRYANIISENTKKAQEASGADKTYWQNATDQMIKAREERRKEIVKDSKFLTEFVANEQMKAKKYDIDNPKAIEANKEAEAKAKADAEKAKNKAKADAEKFKSQQETLLKERLAIIENQQLEEETAWLGAQDKELVILRKGFEKKKAEFVKYGVSTKELEQQYQIDRNNINDKYAKIRDDNEQKRFEEQLKAQKEYDEKLKKISIDAEKALAESMGIDADADIFISQQHQLDAVAKFYEQKRFIEQLEFDAEKERKQGQAEELALLELEYQNRITKINQEEADKRKSIEEESVNKRNEIRQRELQAYSAISNGVSDILGSMSDTLEEGTLGQKSMAIAATTIQTIQSGVAAYNGMVTAIPGPWGIAAGVAAAAASLASGYASVKKIVAVKVNGKTGNSSVPNIDAANFQSAPIVNAQQAQGNNDVRITNPDDMMIRAYIPESDLEDANRRKQFMDNLGGF